LAIVQSCKTGKSRGMTVVGIPDSRIHAFINQNLHSSLEDKSSLLERFATRKINRTKPERAVEFPRNTGTPRRISRPWTMTPFAKGVTR
jgi:hypothetical protein